MTSLLDSGLCSVTTAVLAMAMEKSHSPIAQSSIYLSVFLSVDESVRDKDSLKLYFCIFSYERIGFRLQGPEVRLGFGIALV